MLVIVCIDLFFYRLNVYIYLLLLLLIVLLLMVLDLVVQYPIAVLFHMFVVVVLYLSLIHI